MLFPVLFSNVWAVGHTLTLLLECHTFISMFSAEQVAQFLYKKKKKESRKLPLYVLKAGLLKAHNLYLRWWKRCQSGSNRPALNRAKRMTNAESFALQVVLSEYFPPLMFFLLTMTKNFEGRLLMVLMSYFCLTSATAKSHDSRAWSFFKKTNILPR